MIFTIEVTEDGDIYIHRITREHFDEAINKTPDDDWLGVDPIDPGEIRTKESMKWASHETTDPMYWANTGGRILVIEGEMVTVEPVQEVTKWKAT